jgi:metal-sulfur cluster biosynthetic enzyme
MATKQEVIEVLKTIMDPELFIDIWTLGLIYDVDIEDETLNITMTFTSVACPAGPELAGAVKEQTEALEGIKRTNVDIVFDPPWQPSEDLKAMMGIG